MALGARRADVAGLVLRQAFALELLGLALGLPLALWAAHWLQPLLQGVSARDPETLAAAMALLALAPFAAALPPAWRATRADPLAVLRTEA